MPGDGFVMDALREKQLALEDVVNVRTRRRRAARNMTPDRVGKRCIEKGKDIR